MIVIVCVVLASVSGWLLFCLTTAHPIQRCPLISVAYQRSTVHMWHDVCTNDGCNIICVMAQTHDAILDMGENDDVVSLGFPISPRPIQRVQQNLVYFSGSTGSTANLSRFSQ